MSRKYLKGLLAVTLVLSPTGAFAQSRTLPADCPVEFKSPDVKAHIEKARSLIGKDLPQLLLPGLSLAPRLGGYCAPPGSANYQFDNSPLPAVQAFDQLYFVGSSSVGVWALKTSDGIIMFDAMNNADDAAKIVEPGLRKLGLDPATVKYILITHGHGDHWGGAKYFQDKYGSKVWVGSGDEKIMAPGRAGDPPKVDQLITDGTELKLGTTTMRLGLGPGHTMGSITAIFSVTDNGTPHVVGLFGGFGIPSSINPKPPGTAGVLQFEKSAEKFRDLGKAAGVDVAVSTHPFFDDTITKSKMVEAKRPDKSPWVIGKDGWTRYMDAVAENGRSIEAMLREHPEPVRPRAGAGGN